VAGGGSRSAAHLRGVPGGGPARPPGPAGRPGAPARATNGPPTEDAGGTAPALSPVVPPAARSAPVLLRIPAIGVAVSVSTLGLNPDRTVQVPTDFHQPGWFRLGPSPGQVGSAVILGHVDSYKGPAVFYRLRSLRAGDRVEVGLADGVVAHFVVRKVAMYPRNTSRPGRCMDRMATAPCNWSPAVGNSTPTRAATCPTSSPTPPSSPPPRGSGETRRPEPELDIPAEAVRSRPGGMPSPRRAACGHRCGVRSVTPLWAVDLGGKQRKATASRSGAAMANVGPKREGDRHVRGLSASRPSLHHYPPRSGRARRTGTGQRASRARPGRPRRQRRRTRVAPPRKR
jgi:Sortase domain